MRANLLDIAIPVDPRNAATHRPSMWPDALILINPAFEAPDMNPSTD